jgi:outer membrane protein TolC
MLSGTGPTYYVGLEFKVAIDSSATKYTKSDAMYKYQLAELAKEKALDAAQNSVRDLKAQVTSQFAVATSWVSAVGFRERVVREMEASYRQGRSPLIELIRAYNDLFSAQLERARAVGQYHIYLNQLAAALDELIVDAK